MKSTPQSTTVASVCDFLNKYPHWSPIIQTCLELVDSGIEEFSATWVLKKTRSKGIYFSQNLKPLVTAGILVKTRTSRGGKRAYYKFVDKSIVTVALNNMIASND